MNLAVTLLKAGIERGYFYDDNPPEVLLKMMVASHQVQIKHWLDQGGNTDEIEGLISRMQVYFTRAFVRDAQARSGQSQQRVSG